MKKHAIIPIFIPHRGCPNNCIFCNQKKITARQPDVTPKDVEQIIETWLSTLEGRGLSTIEAAFFGGSFTGLPLDEQSAFLAAAKKFKDAGRIDKIHLSTRPDYIDERILDNLKRFRADTVELGVQSFDEEVLRRSGRGHDSAAVYRSARLIREYDFELGIQLMIGLPGDTRETCLYSARETVKCKPSIARLYPTVIIDDTELSAMYRRGEYQPLAQDEAVFRCKEMYRILDGAGINIIRVGLKSSDIISENGQISGRTFHPAFRQLVEGELAKEKLQRLLAENFPDDGQKADLVFFAGSQSFSDMIGHKSANRKFFLENYPRFTISYKVNPNLKRGQFEIKRKKANDKQQKEIII